MKFDDIYAAGKQDWIKVLRTLSPELAQRVKSDRLSLAHAPRAWSSPFRPGAGLFSFAWKKNACNTKKKGATIVSKRLTYKFTIGAWSPKTIPMARLSAYMSDLSALLGEDSSVHFSALQEGSTVLEINVEKEAIPKVSSRVESFKRGDVPDDVRKHYISLDRRLAEDNATGKLSAFTDDEVDAVILSFPGCERPKPVDYGVVTERGSLDGVPVSIGGRDKTSHIILQDGDKTRSGINLTRSLAIELVDAKCLYRKTVRLNGKGSWKRNREGEWELLRFTVESYDILGDAPLSEVITQLRSVPDSGWEDIDDPDD